MDTLPSYRSTFRLAGRFAILLVAAGSLAAQLPVKVAAADEPASTVPVPPPSSQIQVIHYPPIQPPPAKISKPVDPPTGVDHRRFLRTVSDRVRVGEPHLEVGPTVLASLAYITPEPAANEELIAQAVDVVLASAQAPAVAAPTTPMTTLPALQPVPTASPIPDVPPQTAIVPAGCSTCGSGLAGPSFDLLSGESGECVPGREGFPNGAAPKTAVGRFLYGIYHCVCYPDPCYEPRWTPLADTAFYTPTARPVTQTRFRGNLTRDLGTPDRAEQFWPKGLGATRGPRAPDGRRVRRLDDDSFSIYNEAATGMVGVYTVLTYHRVRPDAGPGASGFGDLILGTKTLLHDCELFQIAFQMETSIPTANSEKGLGTGHLSLEPSVILGVKLSTESYLQAQVAEWIPIGGDSEFAGSAMRYSFAYNHVICRPLPDCPIIGTMEMAGTTFQDGAYTEPATGTPTRASGTSYLAVGGGVRAFICDRVDFGAGGLFGVGISSGPRQEYRIELRVRY